MKKTLLIVHLLALPILAQVAQPPGSVLPALADDFAAVCVGYDGGASHHVIPCLAYGHAMNATMYSYTAIEVVGLNKHPLSAQTVMTTGVCEITHQLKRFFVGACGDVGAASGSPNTTVRAAVGADGVGGIRLGKSGRWALFAKGGVLRVAGDGSQNPVAIGVIYGW